MSHFKTVYRICVVLLLSFIVMILSEIHEYVVNLSQHVASHVCLYELQSKHCFVDNVLFYIPNAPQDRVQRVLCCTGHFFEESELKIVQKYIPKNAVILDIGANIGNHSIYWGKQENIQSVYAFEPVKDTFEILRRNVSLNGLTAKIKIFNIGLSNEKTTASIAEFDPANIGATVIDKSSTGTIQLDKLDNIKIEENKVDFVKIDVEGHELAVLQGAVETLKKYKPAIYIEIWPENFPSVDKLLKQLGYKKVENLDNHENYLYIHE